MHKPSLSVVVPAYNEEESIGHLLESLVEQAEDILEIIVVDNNCTDETAHIALSFADRLPVRIVQESKPGVVHARNAGSDQARGDLIGRLDADARAKPGWARAARTFFASVDDTIGAGSGFFDQYDMPMQSLHRAILRSGMHTDATQIHDTPTLFGANMVVRKSTWNRIRPILLECTGIFDDLDITLCVREIGQRAVVVPNMEISASGRRMLSSVADYKKFTAYMPATYTARGMHAEARAARINVHVMRVMHRVFWLPSRMWDPQTNTWSVRRLFGGTRARVLPYAAAAPAPVVVSRPVVSSVPATTVAEIPAPYPAA